MGEPPGPRGGHPLLPLSLFEHRAFNVGLLVNLGFFSFFGSVLLTLTIFLQEGLKYSPMRAGLTFAPLGVAFALSSLRGRSLHARYGTAIISVGAATALVGVAGLAVVVTVSGLSATSLELSPVLALIGVGNGLVIPLIVSGVLQSVPASATGAASGVLTTTQQFSMTLGIAAVGTLFFAREASAGIVAALQTALLVDVGLVAFALAMTLLLPRRPSPQPSGDPVAVPAGPEMRLAGANAHSWRSGRGHSGVGHADVGHAGV